MMRLLLPITELARMTDSRILVPAPTITFLPMLTLGPSWKLSQSYRYSSSDIGIIWSLMDNFVKTTEKHSAASSAYHSIGMDLCSVMDEDVLQDPRAPLAAMRQPLGLGPPEEVEVVPVGVDS